MKILVFNAGSSSLKYRLFAMPAEETLASGLVERVGERDGRARFRHQRPGRPEHCGQTACANHGQALALVLAELTHPQRGALASLAELDALGHRVVHGGEVFRTPTLIDDAALELMNGLVELAPLHMPPALACIAACRAAVAGLPQVAHFDTVFHQSLPDHAYLYPVPIEWRERHGARRYGFHGSSHEYAVTAAAARLGRPAAELRLITAHLGNGSSLMAWDRGRVLDTSMGFTPLEGVMMGTRPGWIDAALVPYLARKMGISAEAVVDKLNHECGLYGVSGLSRDLRVIGQARAAGHAQADLAWRMYVYRLLKCLGAYFFALGGAEAVVLTGGIGENAWELRRDLFAHTAGLGLALDPLANQALVDGREGFISAAGSPVKIMVVAAQEELVIARATAARLA
ncbi:MAG: acetate/propionate family kinase [Thermodesulfobacteriota bacterium]